MNTWREALVVVGCAVFLTVARLLDRDLRKGESCRSLD